MEMPKKKKPPRLERPKKQYPLNQCGLYGIKGLGALLRLLLWNGSLDELLMPATKDDAYRQWTDNGRKIQACSADLRKVHARIATLLRRVAPPAYRHSGVRGRSFLTNAATHTADEPSLKLDLRRFYPSTTYKHIYQFFTRDMRCAGDVAQVLATICCIYGKHLPTGGVHSEVLAFFCHKRSFDSLADRAERRNGKSSVYVDDIMITMPGASSSDLEWSRRLFAKRGLRIHSGKSQVIPKHGPKLITGVSISRGVLLAPQEQHQKIKLRSEELQHAKDREEAKRIARSLVGHYDHISQIDARFRSTAAGTRTRLKKLLTQD